MEIPPTLRKIVYDELAAARPDLWAKVYPRIYEEVATNGQYCSPKDLACTLIGAAVRIEQGFLGDNEKTEVVWASKLTAHRVPCYWLTPDLAEALKLTTPPQTLNLQTMKLPFEAAVFFLPKGTLAHETDEGEATYVSYYRTELGEQIRSLARGRPEFWFPMGNGVISILAGTTAEHVLHWTIPTQTPVNLGQLDELIQLFGSQWQTHHSEYPLFDSNMNDADNRFMARVTHLVLGTLVLMTARPELVTPGSLQRRIQKKDRPAREFWSPNIIGKNYRLRRLYIPQGGTHASPRFHWVRGFYREQPYGEKHLLRKEIWVEPYQRGLGEDGQ